MEDGEERGRLGPLLLLLLLLRSTKVNGTRWPAAGLQ